MMETENQALKLQIHEFLKNILEHEYNEVFYREGFLYLVQHLDACSAASKLKSDLEDEEAKVTTSSDLDNFSQNLAIDLMNKCIIDDNWRFKQEIINYKLVEKIS